MLAAAARPNPLEKLRDLPVKLVVATGWAIVGLTGGVSQLLALRLSGRGAGFGTAMSGPVLAASIWVPLTFLTLWLGATIPPRSLARVALHLGFAALASLVLNALFQLVSALVSPAGAVWERVLPDALVFLPMNAATYLGILAAREWWVRRPAAAAAPPTAGPETIDARLGSKLSRIPVAEVAWIEARGDYVKLHTATGAHLASRRMGELAELLRPLGFVRIHRSAIVNPSRVRVVAPRSHGDSQVTLDDGTELRVSRQRRRELLAAIDASRSDAPDA
ncbi:MAG: LytTR family DNA-binding domain-containing protein [Gemmatimonadales bacterium]